ncbi:MAG: V-type ATP synthase subunit D [Clostridium sp.]
MDSTFTSAYNARSRRPILSWGSALWRRSHDHYPAQRITSGSRPAASWGQRSRLWNIRPGKEERPPYSFYSTSDSLDEACLAFERVKELTARLATVETSAYRLAESIKKTQKRANALEEHHYPVLSDPGHRDHQRPEEKDREEFTRLKVIKRSAGK